MKKEDWNRTIKKSCGESGTGLNKVQRMIVVLKASTRAQLVLGGSLGPRFLFSPDTGTARQYVGLEYCSLLVYMLALSF